MRKYTATVYHAPATVYRHAITVYHARRYNARHATRHARPHNAQARSTESLPPL